MAYIDPETVVAPRSRVTAVEVLYNSGPGGWSLARLDFDGEECLGIRWNGAEQEPGIGNPQSRGRPTWFVIPGELAAVIRDEIEKFGNSKHAELLSAYSEMAGDREREKEAQEWCEGLIGDAINQTG
jgi:hypothetical protein